MAVKIKTHNIIQIGIISLLVALLLITSALGFILYSKQNENKLSINNISTNNSSTQSKDSKSENTSISLLDKTNKTNTKKDICSWLPNYDKTDAFKTNSETNEIYENLKNIYSDENRNKVIDYVKKEIPEEEKGDFINAINSIFDASLSVSREDLDNNNSDSRKIIDSSVKKIEKLPSYDKVTKKLGELLADDFESIFSYTVFDRLNSFGSEAEMLGDKEKYVLAIIAPNLSSSIYYDIYNSWDNFSPNNKLTIYDILDKKYWARRFTYAILTNNAKNITENNYIQLQFCTIKQDFENREKPNPKYDDYTKNYKLKGNNRQEKLKYLDELIEKGYTENFDQYLKTYAEFYNEQFDIEYAILTKSTTRGFADIVQGFNKEKNVDKSYTPKNVDYNSNIFKKLKYLVQFETREIKNIATVKVDQYYDRNDLIDQRKDFIAIYEQCLNKDNIEFTAPTLTNNSGKVIGHNVQVEVKQLSLAEKEKYTKCKDANDEQLKKLYVEYFSKINLYEDIKKDFNQEELNEKLYKITDNCTTLEICALDNRLVSFEDSIKDLKK